MLSLLAFSVPCIFNFRLYSYKNFVLRAGYSHIMTPKKIVVIIELTNTAIESMDIDAMESRIAINESQPWNASDGVHQGFE